MSKLHFSSISSFYPFYLSQHRTVGCRLLHFVGTTLAILTFFASVFTLRFEWIPLALFFGYGFAWIGHFFVEKNRPATFQFFLYSLICDFIMYFDIWTGKISQRMQQENTQIEYWEKISSTNQQPES